MFSRAVFVTEYKTKIKIINVKNRGLYLHELTAHHTSITAKITKKVITHQPAHRLSVNVLMSNSTFFVIFAVFDV